MNRIITLTACIILTTAMHASTPITVKDQHIDPHSEWQGTHVGILGDSMSDPNNQSTTLHFYHYLSEMIGITPHVYATSGYRWKDLIGKADKMKAEHPDDLDAIFIWAGTNDFNASIPIGHFFTTRHTTVNVNGTPQQRLQRTPIMTDTTFCGSINLLLSKLKNDFPHQQIIILTPIHRGYANYGPHNIQPTEDYANGQDLYLDDYIHALQRAGEIWSIPVIDLYTISGLYPHTQAHDPYLGNTTNDRLHPNDTGHYRLARTIARQLQTLPPTYRDF